MWKELNESIGEGGAGGAKEALSRKVVAFWWGCSWGAIIDRICPARIHALKPYPLTPSQCDSHWR